MGMRILLLEDNTVTRTMLQNTFERHGWEVLSFPDPADCPLYCITSCSCPVAEECVNVIVTDFEMPRMNGCFFVEKLLQKGCRVKHLALLTAAQDTAVVEHAKGLGFVVFNKTEPLLALINWLEDIDAVLRAKRVVNPASPHAGPGDQPQGR